MPSKSPSSAYFKATQPVNGISLSDWNSNILTTTAFQNSVAATMDGVTTSDIVVTGLSSGQSQSSISDMIRITSSQSQFVLVNYTVTYYYQMLGFSSPMTAYSSLSNQLTTSVQIGNFTLYLQTYGDILGCTYLSDASSDEVSTSEPVVIIPSGLNSPTSSPIGVQSTGASANLSSGAVAGIVVFLIVALGSVGGVLYYYFVIKKRSAFSRWAEYYTNGDRESFRSSRSSGMTDVRKSSLRRSEAQSIEEDFAGPTDTFDFVNVSIEASKREKSKQKIQQLLKQKSVKNLTERATMVSTEHNFQAQEQPRSDHSIPMASKRPVKLASSMRSPTTSDSGIAFDRKLSFRISTEASDIYANNKMSNFMPGSMPSTSPAALTSRRPSLLLRASSLMFSKGGNANEDVPGGPHDDFRRGSTFSDLNPIAKNSVNKNILLSNKSSTKNESVNYSRDTEYGKSKDLVFTNPIYKSPTTTINTTKPTTYSGGIFAKTKSGSISQPMPNTENRKTESASSRKNNLPAHNESSKLGRSSEFSGSTFINPALRANSGKPGQPVVPIASAKLGQPATPVGLRQRYPSMAQRTSQSEDSSSSSDTDSAESPPPSKPKQLPLKIDKNTIVSSSIPVQLQSGSPMKGAPPATDPSPSNYSSPASPPSFMRSVASAAVTPLTPNPAKKIGGRDENDDNSSDDSDNNISEEKQKSERTFTSTNPLFSGNQSVGKSSMESKERSAEETQEADKRRSSLLSHFVLPPNSRDSFSSTPKQLKVGSVTSRNSGLTPAESSEGVGEKSATPSSTAAAHRSRRAVPPPPSPSTSLPEPTPPPVSTTAGTRPTRRLVAPPPPISSFSSTSPPVPPPSNTSGIRSRQAPPPPPGLGTPSPSSSVVPPPPPPPPPRSSKSPDSRDAPRK